MLRRAKPRTRSARANAEVLPLPDDKFDRPDVENPVVGPFIAYFDAWLWLTKQIHQQEPLPIDEAGSRAEKTIRRICMNTPEKLTMWGFHKATDAALKRITREDWQGLSINPLAGQPEGDLKALGYRREYGAATKGEYGPVIWTGLCFKRKQFVAAFAPPTQPCEQPPRTRPLRERAEKAIKALYPKGVPDRATMSDAELVRAVNLHILGQGGKRGKRETILRAAGRRK
jgi:hypothetical protein